MVGENRCILLIEHRKSAGWALVNQNSTRVIPVNQFGSTFSGMLGILLGTPSALVWALSGIPAMFKCVFPPSVLACPLIDRLKYVLGYYNMYITLS